MWQDVSVPSSPTLQQITVDSAATALLVMDIQKNNCHPDTRPRCIDTARERRIHVVFTTTPNAAVSDIRTEVAPITEEPVFASGVNKFYNTGLEENLNQTIIHTLILTGTAAEGAVLQTTAEAAVLGFRVIILVDGLFSSEVYAEQYTVWHLANLPGTRKKSVFTLFDMIDFS
jgi:nicotinamidase-related amidase